MFRRSVCQVSRQIVRRMETKASEVLAKRSTLVSTGEKSVNKVTLLGRVGRNAEIRGTVDRPVTVFPLATSITIKRVDDTYEQLTEWHRISIFRRGLRDIVASSVEAGDRVYVSGTIRYNKFKNDDGETMHSTNIIADDVIRLSKKPLKSPADGYGD